MQHGLTRCKAIREHKYEHVFANPGEADLSAYVDFAALKNSLMAMPGEWIPFEWFGGPDRSRRKTRVRQRTCHSGGPLEGMSSQTCARCANMRQELGIEARLVSLLVNAGEEEQKTEQLIADYRRLVDGDEMGTIYKALSFSSSPEPIPGFP